MQTTIYNSRFRKTAMMVACAAAFVCCKSKVDGIAHADSGKAPAAATKPSAPVAEPDEFNTSIINGTANNATLLEGLNVPWRQSENDMYVQAVIARGPSIVRPLLAAIVHGTYKQLPNVITALNGMGEAAVPTMIKVMKSDKELLVRVNALSSLCNLKRAGKIGPETEPAVIAAMVAMLSDEEVDMRRHASQNIAKFGAAAIGPLIAALDDPRTRYEDGVESYAADALIFIGQPSVAPLIAMTKDPDEDKRVYAARSLSRIGEPALPELREGLKGAPLMQMGCMMALGYIDDAKSINPIIRLLHSRTTEVSATAALNLGRLHARKALPELKRMAHDKNVDPFVQNIASEAVSKIQSESGPGSGGHQ